METRRSLKQRLAQCMTRRTAILLVVVGIGVPLGHLGWICFGPYESIEISKGTTYFTEPLTPDGRYVDYTAAVGIPVSQSGKVSEWQQLIEDKHPSIKCVPLDFRSLSGLSPEEADELRAQLWETRYGLFREGDAPLVAENVRTNTDWLRQIVSPKADRGFTINSPFSDGHRMLLNDNFTNPTRGSAETAVVRSLNFALGEGRFDDAFELLVFCFELADELRSQPNIYGAVRGKDWCETACRTIFLSALSDQDFSDEQLRKLDGLLPDEQTVEAHFRVAFPSVRAKSLSMVQWMHAHGRPFPTMWKRTNSAWHRDHSMTFRCTRFRRCVRWNEILRSLNELFDSLESSQGSATPRESGATAVQALKSYNARFDAGLEMEVPGYGEYWKWIRGGDFTPIVAMIAVPQPEAVDAVLRAPLREIASIRIARIAIRMRVYRNLHGKLPDQLSDLRSLTNWETPSELLTEPCTQFPFDYRVKGNGFAIVMRSATLIPNSSGLSSTRTPGVEGQWVYPVPGIGRAVLGR